MPIKMIIAKAKEMTSKIDTYLKYGILSTDAEKYLELGLSATNLKQYKIVDLVMKYGLPEEEVKRIKTCLQRQPIEDKIIYSLLTKNNFLCCCCRGTALEQGIGYIIHHIESYEISQNNDYENLAVLCTHHHDLAHREGISLTKKITKDQIIKSKKEWEIMVESTNSIASSKEIRQEFLAQIPKYQAIQKEIKVAKSELSKIEKIGYPYKVGQILNN